MVGKPNVMADVSLAYCSKLYQSLQEHLELNTLE